MNTIFIKTLKRFWPAIGIGLAWLWIFWPIVTGAEVVGFRDSAYLYYPLFKWIDAQWAQSLVPLWNPQCNLGMPVIHDGSSSVFYPGKLIFFLRALPYPARYGIYVAIHIPLAATGTYWFSKTLRASKAGATLAAVAYAFGGPVLFQTTNVVFLVSAAWLPFALGCVWLMYRQPRLKWALLTGVCCAMMILGGDPQMCYHVGLIMAAFGLWKFLRYRRRCFRVSTPLRKLHEPYRVLWQAFGWMAVTIATTAGLAAVQWIPSYVWSQDSIRSIAFQRDGQVRNVYEVLANRRWVKAEDAVTGIAGVPRAGTHHDHAYQFSQPPWTVGELIWPNVSGKTYPGHQRWIDGLPGAERMWNPSMYFGCFVLLLALAGWNPFSRHRSTAWLSRIAIFFGVASLGWYGGIWLAQEVAPKSPALQDWGPPVGGLYWLMVVAFPKYIMFRYPAKLVVVAGLGLCVLAGLNLDRVARKDRWLPMVSVGGLILLGSLLILVFARRLTEVGHGTASELFGPFDASGCLWTIRLAAWTSAVVIAVCLALYFPLKKHRTETWKLAIVLICSIEILMSNVWLVPTIDADVFERPGQWATWSKGKDQPMVYRDPALALPPEWTTETSPNRLEEMVQWQRDSLQAKHHLNEGIQLIGSFSSLEPRHKPHQSIGSPYDGSYFVARDAKGDLVLDPVESSGTSRFQWYAGFYDWDATRLHWVNCNELQFTVDARDSNGFDPDQIVHTVLELESQRVRGWKVTAKDLATSRTFVPQQRRTADSQSNELSVALPFGSHYLVTARYEPPEFFWGAWISVLSWLAVIVGLILCVRRDSRG